MLFFGCKTVFFIKIIHFFFIQTGKVFKIYSFYLSCFKFDAALFTYIYPVVFTYKTCQNIFFFFASETDISILGYILGNACFAIS